MILALYQATPQPLRSNGDPQSSGSDPRARQLVHTEAYSVQLQIVLQSFSSFTFTIQGPLLLGVLYSFEGGTPPQNWTKNLLSPDARFFCTVLRGSCRALTRTEPAVIRSDRLSTHQSNLCLGVCMYVSLHMFRTRYNWIVPTPLYLSPPLHNKPIKIIKTIKMIKMIYGHPELYRVFFSSGPPPPKKLQFKIPC